MNKPRLIDDNQILSIAKRQGWFFVSWRYRDDYLRGKCKKLVLKGKLKWGEYKAGRDLFLPV